MHVFPYKYISISKVLHFECCLDKVMRIYFFLENSFVFEITKSTVDISLERTYYSYYVCLCNDAIFNIFELHFFFLKFKVVS